MVATVYNVVHQCVPQVDEMSLYYVVKNVELLSPHHTHVECMYIPFH